MIYGNSLPHTTTSVCPVCNRILPAVVYRKGNEVWIKRTCPEHGEFDEVYYEDYEIYERFRKFAKFNGKYLETFQVDYDGKECPFQCGLCSRHLSNPALTNIVVTNRCDLSCWYCFFFAERAGYVYEPTIEQIKGMLGAIKSTKPIAGNAVQFTGGEPMLRKDIFEIVRMAKEDFKFGHVQLNTTGIQIGLHPEYAKKLRPYVSTIYMSFDGVSPEKNPKNHWEVPLMFKALRNAGGPGVVLVPTLINGVNTGEMGDILAFALNNLDIVQGVNFQPLSFTGMATKQERKKFRITIPGAIKEVEKQTNGAIPKNAWYPVPAEIPISEFLNVLLGMNYPFNSHFACGAATYVFLNDGKITPISEIVDIDNFLEFLWKFREKGKISNIDKLKIATKLPSFVNMKKVPGGMNFTSILKGVVLGNWDSIVEFHRHALFIGMMHFMDKFNYDVERVERCAIPYATPDGRLIPFCAFNIFPETYRDKIQKKLGVPIEEWEKKHEKMQKYVRTKEFVRNVEESKAYRETYRKKVYW